MNNENAIKLLTQSSKFRIELGLERIKQILKLLNNPEKNLKVIHVAGTNGKGSVCAMLSSILTSSGFKVGLYTSPHIVDYTERIKINNVDITKKDFTNLIFEICKSDKKNNINLTEFEILTVAAFLYFSKQNTDFVILETGLGGRFDATNVVENPLLEIITDIDLDHTERLGNSIEKIAFEKAGIIKENSKVVISDKNKGFEVIKKVAKEKKAKIFVADKKVELSFEGEKNYCVIENEKFEFSLWGLWQKDNLELVLKAVEILNIEANLKEGLKKVKWKCRFEKDKKRNMIFDGCHNPSGARLLRKSLETYFPDKNFTFVYGSLNNKKYEEILKILIKKGDEVYFCEFDYPNSEKINLLAKNFSYDFKKINEDKILALTSKNPIIVCGSFYMLGKIFQPRKI